MDSPVDFYVENGVAPVEDFLLALEKPARAKALALIQHLRTQGMNLGFPHSSKVKGKLRELRTQYGKDRIRILYFSDSKRTFILLHAIIKRTKKLEEADIRTAQHRMELYETRVKGKHHGH